MCKAKVIYLLSEAGKKNSLIKGGDGREKQVIEIEATPEIIELATVNEAGKMYLGIGCIVNSIGEIQRHYGPLQRYKLNNWSFENPPQFYKWERWTGIEPSIESVSNFVYFNTVQTVDELITHEKDRLEKIKITKAEAEAELIVAKEKYNEKKQAFETKLAESKAESEAEKKSKEEAIRDAEQKSAFEKATWIKQHGSQYLKDCLELNVDAEREYVLERAKMEHPEYEVDYYNNTTWNKMVSPSIEAVAELKRLRGIGVEAQIVWLTSPITKDDEDDYYDSDFEEQEAAVIRNYLGEYDLVRTDI